MNDAYELGVQEGMKKVAIDPFALAGGVAAAKITAANIMSRHGDKIPGMKRLTREIAGVGVRTAAQGKPRLGRVTREALSAVTAPSAVGLYEDAYKAGKAAKNQKGLKAMKGLMSSPQADIVARKIPQLSKAREFWSGVPTESKGIRRGIDYLFSDVRSVARDIRDMARKRRQA